MRRELRDEAVRSVDCGRELGPLLVDDRQHPARRAQRRHRAEDHAVQVLAESLYEAAVEAMAAFRRSVLAEMPLGSATRLTIGVKAPEEQHTVTIGKVLAWLDGVATSPSEKLKKNR